MTYVVIGAYQSVPMTSPTSEVSSTRIHVRVSQKDAPFDARRKKIPEAMRPVTTVIAYTPSGTMTSATSAFASTVRASETGIDFQKRMLRSRRSAYRHSAA